MIINSPAGRGVRSLHSNNHWFGRVLPIAERHSVRLTGKRTPLTQACPLMCSRPRSGQRGGRGGKRTSESEIGSFRRPIGLRVVRFPCLRTRWSIRQPAETFAPPFPEQP